MISTEVVVDKTMVPAKIATFSSPEAGICYHTRQKELCRCDCIKDPEMGRLSWII